MATTLSTNTLIAQRFRILALAGSGGMGTVYRAEDLQTGQTVALKLLTASGKTTEERQRFRREAQLLADLHHPRIVSYIAHGQTEDGRPYLAMDWLDGEDLGQRLHRQPLTLSESMSLLRQVAEALSVAHLRGIIHRDLKPANLFLSARQLERVTLLDFGIARRTGGTSLAVPTQTGILVGTPEYMAPEQARGKRDLTPSADIFSLGCVLFECLTGQPPFVAEHLVGVLAKILFEDPPLGRLRPELGEDIVRLVSRMLAKPAVLRAGA